MIKGYRFQISECPECNRRMPRNFVKRHLVLHHKFIYTQESPNYPVRRPDVNPVGTST